MVENISTNALDFLKMWHSKCTLLLAYLRKPKNFIIGAYM